MRWLPRIVRCASNFFRRSYLVVSLLFGKPIPYLHCVRAGLHPSWWSVSKAWKPSWVCLDAPASDETIPCGNLGLLPNYQTNCPVRDCSFCRFSVLIAWANFHFKHIYCYLSYFQKCCWRVKAHDSRRARRFSRWRSSSWRLRRWKVSWYASSCMTAQLQLQLIHRHTAWMLYSILSSSLKADDSIPL